MTTGTAPRTRSARPRTRLIALAGAAGLLLTPALPASAEDDALGANRLRVEVLSSRADQVSGGDALVRVSLGSRIAADDVSVTLNGADVTDALPVDPGGRSLTGVIDGLRAGPNDLRASGQLGRDTQLTLTNHPIAGPIFSGPQQYPFLCRTEQAGLGQPIVDNQVGQGLRVFALDAAGNKTTQVIGWSRDCAATTVVDLLYRATNGSFKPMPADGSRPADMTT